MAGWHDCLVRRRQSATVVAAGYRLSQTIAAEIAVIRTLPKVAFFSVMAGFLSLSAITTAFAAANEQQELYNTSYALGMQFADNVRAMLPRWDIDSKSFTGGVQDALTGSKLRMSHAEISSELRKIDDYKDKPPAGADMTSLSYALGAFTSRQLTINVEELAMQPFLAGVRDMIDNIAPMLSDEQASEYLQAYFAKVQRQQQQLATANLERNQKFFADNGNKVGVKTHSSGMQYKIMRAGTGKRPAPDSEVKVHYTGTLLDGTEFDTSRRGHNEPVSFSLDRVIKGWQIALPMMSTGALWRLWLPPDLAYGIRGAPPDIGPNQALMFDIELLATSRR